MGWTSFSSLGRASRPLRRGLGAAVGVAVVVLGSDGGSMTSVVGAAAGRVGSTSSGTEHVADPGEWTPEFREAWDRAAQDSHADGVDLTANSGHRSAAEQQELWEQAVAAAGSEQKARETTLPPSESAHVAGTAADVSGPSADWLELHGWRYGLCLPYQNEWWHVELSGEPGEPCPPQQATAAG